MKHKKMLAIVCSMALGMSIALSGCGTTTEDTATSTTTDTTDTTVESTETEEAAASDSIFGQISSIDGDTITIALAEMPTMGDAPSGDAQSGEALDGTEMPEMEEGSTEMPEAPTGEEGSTEMGEKPDGEATDSTEMGEAPSGDMTSDKSQMELTLTGEEMTITIDDSTEITVNGETATVSDLAEGDTITVTMDGDTVVSIQSGMSMGGKGDNGQTQMKEDTDSTETSATN